LLKKIERYIISPIHPKLEIKRNIVASINELSAIVGRERRRKMFEIKVDKTRKEEKNV